MKNDAFWKEGQPDSYLDSVDCVAAMIPSIIVQLDDMSCYNYLPFVCQLFPEKCPYDRYGPNCSEHCSPYCVGSSCDSSTGHCMSGKCASGYEGKKCDSHCSTRTFGKKCSKTCSPTCLGDNDH
ncbi:hypothetical protein EGW08_022695, partial [Elysia chlorotica]